MQDKDDGPADVTSIEIHFIKSPLFRVIHCDGVWGGITPSGEIHMSTFSERSAIPQRLTMGVTPSRPSDPPVEVSRTGKSGIVREVDADVVMSINTAKRIHEWLGAKLEEYEKLRKAIQSVENTKG